MIALDIDTGSGSPPQNNGDLHALHLATQWAAGWGPGTLRLAFAPAVSTSSNGMKNPDELDSEAFQFWGAALYAWPAGPLQWVAGVAHDYRFGENRVYPVAGLEWQRDRLALRAVFPDLNIRLGADAGWALEFRIEPDGNEWLAYDRDLENSDTFQREAWQSDLRLSYRFRNGIGLGVSAGYYWQQEWEFRREDGSLAQTDGDDSPFFGLHLGWRQPRETR